MRGSAALFPTLTRVLVLQETATALPSRWLRVTAQHLRISTSGRNHPDCRGYDEWHLCDIVDVIIISYRSCISTYPCFYGLLISVRSQIDHLCSASSFLLDLFVLSTGSACNPIELTNPSPNLRGKCISLESLGRNEYKGDRTTI